MTERLVVDYAFDRPDLSAFQAQGFVGTARYIAPLPNGKVIGTDAGSGAYDGLELSQIQQTLGAFCLVWETTADRSLAGYTAGQSDATRANEFVDSLALPKCAIHGDLCPIYFAVDTDTTYTAVADYFHGAIVTSKRPVGLYGSYGVCVSAQMDGIRYLWQTVAWSNGKLLTTANLYQRNYHSHEIPGNWDENVVLQDDWGQWCAETSTPTPTEPTTKASLLDMVMIWHKGAIYLITGGRRSGWGLQPHAVDVLHAAGVPITGNTDDDQTDLFSMLPTFTDK